MRRAGHRAHPPARRHPGTAVSFILFALVLGVVHAELSDSGLNALGHPLWIVIGTLGIAALLSRLAIGVAHRLPKRSLAQVALLVATALLAVGLSRMLAVPVFLTLFVVGALLALKDRDRALALFRLPEGRGTGNHLFVAIGASLPWQEVNAVTYLPGRRSARHASGLPRLRPLWASGGLAMRRRFLCRARCPAAFDHGSDHGLWHRRPVSGIRPFRPALPLFAAAIMEWPAPVLPGRSRPSRRGRNQPSFREGPQ